MVNCSVIAGSSEAGKMVLTSLPGTLGSSGRSNSMVSAPATRLARAIASLRVHSLLLQPPLPGSPTELTVKVRSAWAGLAVSKRLAAKSAASTKPKTKALLLTTGHSIFARIILLCSFQWWWGCFRPHHHYCRLSHLDYGGSWE